MGDDQLNTTEKASVTLPTLAFSTFYDDGMAKTLAAVLAVSIAALLFASCGGGTPVESSTTSTTAKTVVDTFCAERPTRAGDLFSDDELRSLASTERAVGLEYGVVTLVWSDGSIGGIKKTCIRWIHPLGPIEIDPSRWGLD